MTVILLYFFIHFKMSRSLWSCKGNISSLEFLSQKNPELLKSRDECGAGPIHHAAASANLAVIRLIVTVVAPEELNTQDDHGRTPLHWAVEKNQEGSCSLLLELGADPNILNLSLTAPLHLAISLEHNNLVQVSLTHCCYMIKRLMLHMQDNISVHCLWILIFIYFCYNDRATLFDHVELAEYLVSKGADIDCIDCKGLSPLLLATTCSAWKTVSFLLLKGADFRVKDKAGRNFLHLVIFQPKGLKNLPENLLQVRHKAVRELMSDEDYEGCTPLHYACKLGIHDSVKNMLSQKICLGRKSKQKKSGLHFAAEYGRLNTCIRLLETISDSRLLNEGEENGLTPLHLASRGGHTKVVELLLRRGALFQSDYKGWSCLHHAAAEGYTQTMVILLAANVKLLDYTNEEGNTALHLAARAGHVAAVKLLLNRGALFMLNKNGASFLHEAVRNGKKEVANAAIENESEALSLFKKGPGFRCVVLDLIEFLPESTKVCLYICREYLFIYLVYTCMCIIKIYMYILSCLQAMVQYNRLELLTHPVCQKYLEMKWKAYGSKVHLLNLAVYLLGLLPLTYLIINLKPTQNTSVNGTTVTMASVSFRTQSYMISVCIVMVLVMNVYAICKELVQLAQQRLIYFMDSTNVSDWASAISSLVFVIPLFFSVDNKWHWEAGALAILFAWINFLLYFQRFERFGIYVVMFGEIIKTLISTIVLFVFLLLAFGLSFYALMLHRFNSISLSLAQTFVMTVGELNYQNTLLEAYEQGQLAFPEISYFIFVLFVLLMPILLMNLMIGLAVGDIAEVQRNATLKRIAMQINLHTNLEEKLPYWYMKRVDKPSITIYPNKKCEKFWNFGEETEVRVRLNTNARKSCPLEREIMKQKYRLKEISSVLEKQHNLLKLIIQKMEITSEADEHDGPQDFRAITSALPSSISRGSRWVPLIRALGVKK
uniref:Transient receptor potential cation channel, subfamily A, member 1b n=1 Tax=Astyanax mexicanus TaxID=7994 RepID=A0A8B9HBS6_ASTMX